METETTRVDHFRVNGEGLTNLIRQTWAEGRLSVAFTLCEDSGAPSETHIDICTGKQKISGVGELWLEPDNTTHWNNINITIEESIKRIEDQYVKLHTKFANADLRMRYFTLRCDYAGIKYRNPKLELFQCDTYAKDEIIIKRVGKELAELEPLFSVLYPLVNKTIGDLPYHRFTDEEPFEVDLDHPYYLPNLKKPKDFIEERTEFYSEVSFKYGTPTFPKKAIEIESYEDLTKPGELPEMSNHNKPQPIFPSGIDNDYVENAWISRSGDFYGDPRLSFGNVWIHIELANRLSENGIVPFNNGNPETWMEENGWVKLSRNEVLFNPKNDIDYSDEQIETLKKYAEYRKLKHITIGYFGKQIDVKKLDALTHYR